MVAAGLAGFMMVRNGAGKSVRQQGRWRRDELMSSLHAEVVRARDYDDDDDDEWDSEWGDMPGEGGGATATPPWRMGGPPEVILTAGEGTSRGRRRPGTAPPTGRRGPVAVSVTPSTSVMPHTVGAAGVEAQLREWLAVNRAVHEPRRMTLIRMLGAGLNPVSTNSATATANTDTSTGVGVGGTSGEFWSSSKKKGSRMPLSVGLNPNGLPLDADGRPVGIRATFPNAKYAAVDHLGKPLPLEERVTFRPKPLPPSKRSYHPLTAPPVRPDA